MRTGLLIIKQFEGCKLKAYLCPANVWTIGWGRTTNVKRGDTCTQAQADAWLDDEYDAFERGVLNLLDDQTTTPNMLGAMVSLAYNIGLGAFGKSSVLRNHLARRYTSAAASFEMWNKGGSKVLPGLVRRRAAEAVLYLS